MRLSVAPVMTRVRSPSKDGPPLSASSAFRERPLTRRRAMHLSPVGSVDHVAGRGSSCAMETRAMEALMAQAGWRSRSEECLAPRPKENATNDPELLSD